MVRLAPILNALMASSEFGQREIQSMSLPMMRELVLRCVSLTLTLAIFPAAFYNWHIGLQLLAALEFVLVVVLAINTWLLLRQNVRVFSPMALLMIAAVILTSTIALGVTDFIYFCYAFPVAFYLIVERRTSLLLNLFWWMACGVLAVVKLSPLGAISFVASHAAVVIFLEVLFSIIARFEEQLRQLAVRDPLTNAYNRRAMKEAMEYALMMQERYDDASTIIMLDIDHFKTINDNYGHKEGDLVLKGLVNLIAGRLRGTDKLCRFGGEEFVILLANTHKKQAFQLAETIREQVAAAILTSKTPVTISCGVAESRAGDTVKEWLHRCDQALYQAKNSGRDRVELEAVA